MNEILEEIRKYINSGYFKNEENIRFSLVARILQKLGWDIWNPKEVATEFPVLPNEDSTRVDIALFDNTPSPSVFIETKALGKLETELAKYEVQLRDYNRNNTALFSVITDGREWRFYYSQTGGEFSQKCFKVLDLLNDDFDDIELSFYTFLSKEDIRSGKAKNEAETYLKLTQKQRAMEDALPQARRQILESPFPSLPEALVKIVAEEGYTVSIEEASRFVKKQGAKKPKLGPVVITPPVPTPPSGNKRNGSEPEYIKGYRKQLNNPNNLISKIKRHIDNIGSIKRKKLNEVCAKEFGCKSENNGSINASIRVLVVDGHITVNGRGASAIINSMQK
jgi:hypothetical protein